jgi:hypothetical protein
MSVANTRCLNELDLISPLSQKLASGIRLESHAGRLGRGISLDSS